MVEPHAVVRLRTVAGEEEVRDAVVVGADGRVVGLQRTVGGREALSDLALVEVVSLTDEGRAIAGDALQGADVLERLLDGDAHVAYVAE